MQAGDMPADQLAAQRRALQHVERARRGGGPVEGEGIRLWERRDRLRGEAQMREIGGQEGEAAARPEERLVGEAPPDRRLPDRVEPVEPRQQRAVAGQRRHPAPPVEAVLQSAVRRVGRRAQPGMQAAVIPGGGCGHAVIVKQAPGLLATSSRALI